MKFKAIILAGGKGTRMKSELPKVLHETAGLTMVEWAIKAVSKMDKKPVLVVGYGADQVKEIIGDRADYAIQAQQKGTGHAVMMAMDYIKDNDYVLVTCGDTILLQQDSVERIVNTTIDNDYDGVVMTAVVDNPFGLGRIIRDEKGNVARLVEQKDATDEQRKVCEINSGVFCLKAECLKKALPLIGRNNAQGEYYLTDIVEIMTSQGLKFGAVQCPADEGLGINDRSQLAIAGKILRERINEKHMKNGVTLVDPDNTYIDENVIIGANSKIYPSNVIEGKTIIGENCTIYGTSNIKDSTIADNVGIISSTIIDAKIDEHTKVGPNAYLRPNAIIGKHCKIGNFVEIKNSNIGDNTKISHLTYVGDADVGQNVNLGCGVVFVNYDGKKKHRTKVCDNAFIGCNTNLVSPVVVGKNAYTAAGSTITEDVPPSSLAIARNRQVNKDGWADNNR